MMLPKKSFAKQVGDGIDSLFDGLGWALTMFAARGGGLGPEIQAQAEQIDHTLANVASVAVDRPAAAGSVALAAVETYPYQIGARAATNIAVTRGLSYLTKGAVSTNSSYASAGAATYGTFAHEAFVLGGSLTYDDLAVSAATGFICPTRKE
jgi:hypothetical protein